MDMRSVRINITDSTRVEKRDLEDFLIGLNENIATDFYHLHGSISYSKVFKEWASYPKAMNSDMTIDELITKFSKPKPKFTV